MKTPTQIETRRLNILTELKGKDDPFLKTELNTLNWVLQSIKIVPDSERQQIIIDLVSKEYSVTFNECLCGYKNRMRINTEMRQMIFYLTRKHTKLSLAAIGAPFNKDHATVRYSINNFSDLLDVDNNLLSLTGKIDDVLKKIFDK